MPDSPEQTRIDALAARIAAGRSQEVVRAYRDAPDGWMSVTIEARILVAGAAARTGDYRLATELADASRELLEQGDDDHTLFRALNILGGVAFERGRLETAWGWYDRAHRVAGRLDDPALLAKVTNNMASIRHRTGDATEAALLYRRALAWYAAAGDPRGGAETRHNLSIVDRAAGRLDDALAHASEACALAERVGDPGLIGLTLAGLTAARLALGTLDSAEPIARSRELALEAGDAVGAVETDRLQAEWHLRQRRFAKAVAAAEAARSGARALGAVITLRDCDETAAAAWESAGNRMLAGARRDEARLLAQLLAPPDLDGGAPVRPS